MHLAEVLFFVNITMTTLYTTLGKKLCLSLLLDKAMGQVEMPVPWALLQAHDRVPHRLQVLRDVRVLVALPRELLDQPPGALQIIELPLQERELRAQLAFDGAGLVRLLGLVLEEAEEERGRKAEDGDGAEGAEADGGANGHEEL